MYEDSVIVAGGSGTEGLHASGRDLIFDGKVIAKAGSPKRGIYINNGTLFYGDAYALDYPQGLTTLFNNTVHWYTVNPHYGAKQGAAIYGDFWYQFYSAGHVIVFSISRAIKVREFDIPNELWPHADANHCASAAFSREYANADDELPLCYISTSVNTTIYVCVVNLNGTPTLVRWFTIEYNNDGLTTQPASGSWAVYDFDTNRGWALGYPRGVPGGSGPHANAGVYEIIPFTFVQSGSGDISSQITIDYTNRHTIEKANVTYLNEPEAVADDSLGDRDWSNIQDGDYKDGHIYILNGGSNGHADRPKILDYDVTTGTAKMMYTNIYRIADDIKVGVEGEGIACFHNGWLVSGLYSADKIFVL